jgi:hypothetical protein
MTFLAPLFKYMNARSMRIDICKSLISGGRSACNPTGPTIQSLKISTPEKAEGGVVIELIRPSALSARIVPTSSFNRTRGRLWDANASGQRESYLRVERGCTNVSGLVALPMNEFFKLRSPPSSPEVYVVHSVFVTSNV